MRCWPRRSAIRNPSRLTRKPNRFTTVSPIPSAGLATRDPRRNARPRSKASVHLLAVSGNLDNAGKPQHAAYGQRVRGLGRNSASVPRTGILISRIRELKIGINTCLVGQITGITPPSPRHHEGRSRDRHGTWRGLRWTLLASGGFTPAGRNVRSGRRSRVVLAPRPWRQVGAKYRADDGGKTAAHRGEHV